MGLSVAAAALLYRVPLFTAHTFFYRDFLTSISSDVWVKSHALREGHWPLWNPAIFCGYSFASNPGAQTFYPLTALLALPSGLAVFIAIHHLIAAWGTAAWARRLGASSLGAALAGVAFGFSAFSVSLDNLMLHLCSYAWLPWVLWAVEDLIVQRWRTGLVGTSVFLALVFLAGDPQATMFAGALGAARVATASSSPGRWRGLAVLVLAGAFMVGLVAVSLMPALRYLQTSNRLDGVTLESALQWSLHPGRWVELIIARPFGDYYPNRSFWGDFTLHSELRTPYLLSLYVGVVFALAVPLGFSAMPRRLQWLFGVASVLLLLGSLGDGGGVYPVLFNHLPGWKVFRYPERLVPVLMLLFSVCGGLGFDALGASRRWLWVAFVVLASFAGATWALGPALVDGLHAHGVLLVTRDNFAVTTQHVVQSALLVGLAAVLVSSRWRWAKDPRWLALLVAADVLGQASSFVWSTSLDELRALAPSFAQEPGRRVYSSPAQFVADPVSKVPYEEQVIQYLARTIRANVAGAWGAEYMAAYSTNFPLVFSKMWRSVATLPLLRLWGVIGGVSSRAEFERAFASSQFVQRVGEFDDQVAFTIKTSEAREWLSANWRPLTNRDDLRAWLGDLERAGDERVPTLLEAPLSNELTALGKGEAVAIDERLTCRRHGPNERRCEVRLGRPSVLVISEAYDADWHAWVDERPATVHKVNLAMQGLALDAGDHHVLVRYVPELAVTGGFISVGALFALLLVAWRLEGWFRTQKVELTS